MRTIGTSVIFAVDVELLDDRMILDKGVDNFSFNLRFEPIRCQQHKNIQSPGELDSELARRY